MLSFLAWIVLVPLFLIIDGKNPKRAFWLAYLYGFIFFICTIYWIYHVTVIGLVLLVAYLALYFGIFGWGQAIFFQKKIAYPLFLLPAFWIVLEYIRSHLFTGFGWALLGYSQYRTLPVIQIADITGAYGVSFLIVMANVAIATVIGSLREPMKSARGNLKMRLLPATPPRGSRLRLRLLTMTTGITLAIVGLSLGYGYYKLSHQPEGYALRVSVVQGNVPQEEKWDEAHKDEILKRYISLTKEASKDSPDLIIWPETSAPGFINADEELQRGVSDLADDVGKPLLVGAPTIDETGRYRNSAVLFSEEGDIVKQHDKLHLVPYGEFIPFEKELPFFRKLIVTGDFVPGKEWTIFSLNQLQALTSQVKLVQGQARHTTHFGVLICFEDIFPDLVRGFINRGADFMVNITNDAWFKKTQAPYQHAQASVFRAVENRVSVVRSANTGLSCFISPTGKITDSVKDKSGEEIFIAGHKTADVVIGKYGRTFYTRYGDVFVWLCAGFSLFMIIRKSLAGKSEDRDYGRET